MSRLGVAVSGGGHRATVFALGALLYLADVQANRQVVAISSVSGGSIANAFVGLQTDYRQCDPQTFRDVAARLAHQVASRGTFFAWWGTRVYLVTLVVGLVATFAVWLLPLGFAARLALFVAALLLWEFALLRRRGVICGRAYAATVLRGEAEAAQLSDIRHDDIDHVICATHLHAGEHIYFSGDFVYSYRFGLGVPADLGLHVAVQASTALPGAFPPRWIGTSRHRFGGGSEDVPGRLALADGGVYDNLAEQWLVGRSRRAALPPTVQEPDTFIVVNSSASMRMLPVGAFHLPIVGEIAALKRSSSIMYDNSASLRKRDLVDRFDSRAALSGGEQSPMVGMAGALVDIRSDPFAAAHAFADQDERWPKRARRARAILAQQPPDWASDAAWAAGVKTTLSKLGVDVTARLLRHGYALTAMNLHLFLDMPLVEIPPLEDFVALAETAPTRRGPTESR